MRIFESLNQSDRAAVVTICEQGAPRFILEKLPPDLLYALAEKIEHIARERERELQETDPGDNWAKRLTKPTHPRR